MSISSFWGQVEVNVGSWADCDICGRSGLLRPPEHKGGFLSVATLKDDFLHLRFSCRRRDKEMETEMVKNKLMGRRHGGILRL